eukprot:11884247-Ditylum_brightwellii.AAC.1
MEEQVKEKNDDIVKGRIQVDSHADTMCEGKNTLPLHHTGQVYNVMQYSTEYKPIKDVPIKGAIMAWTSPLTGQTILLELQQVLLFCDQLETSLLNPNQVRCSRYMLCDDFTDQHRELSIQVALGKIEIPFEIDGVIIGFETCTPTQEELENCPRIALTDNISWKPSDISLNGETSVNKYLSSTTSFINCAGVDTNSYLNEPQLNMAFCGSNILMT